MRPASASSIHACYVPNPARLATTLKCFRNIFGSWALRSLRFVRCQVARVLFDGGFSGLVVVLLLLLLCSVPFWTFYPANVRDYANHRISIFLPYSCAAAAAASAISFGSGVRPAYAACFYSNETHYAVALNVVYVCMWQQLVKYHQSWCGARLNIESWRLGGGAGGKSWWGA